MDNLILAALNAAALRPDGVQPEAVAYQQGRDACTDGYSDDTCPYRRSDDPALYDAWINGWEYEFCKHERDAESDERDRQLLQRRA